MQDMYLAKLAESMVEVLDVLTGEAVVWEKVQTSLPAIQNKTIFVSILGFSGKVHGRIVMELDMEAAQAIGDAMNGESLKPYDKMVFAALAELSNMFSGKAITVINNTPERPGLRLTPPSVLVGEQLEIFSDTLTLVSACLLWREKPVYIHFSLERGKTSA